MPNDKPFCPLCSSIEGGRFDCSPDCRWLVNTGEIDENGLDCYACAVVAVIAERLIRQQAGE